MLQCWFGLLVLLKFHNTKDNLYLLALLFGKPLIEEINISFLFTWISLPSG